MDLGYKGNALEKVEDAEAVIAQLLVKLSTGQITTEELIYWLKKAQTDLKAAKHFAGLI